MKGFELFQNIGKIDDKFIMESESYKKRSTVKSFPFIAAACFVVVVSAVLFIMPRRAEELPILTIPAEFNSSMGFEGTLAYDISDIPPESPVGNGSGIDELTVYTNKYPKSNFYLVSDPDYDAMQALLIKTAQSLGIETDNVVIENNGYTEEERAELLSKSAYTVGEDISEEDIEEIPDGMEITTLPDGRVHIGPVGEFDLTEYYIESDGMKVSVDTTLETTVEFENSIISSLTSDDNYDDILNASDELIVKLYDFIDMENPQITVTGGGYNIYGKRSYDIYIYEGGESEFDVSTNYKFDYIWFMVSEDGSITKAIKYSTDILEPVASYPIISADEAENLLLEGNFISTVPDTLPDENLIRRVELIYRNDSELEIFIPYYRFYIELPEHKDEELSLNSYGAFYLPAVEGQYIENMPMWDGDFN